MAKDMTPDGVADTFVRNYYKILSHYPKTSYKFYKESSLLSWPDSDGVRAPVTTLSAINEKIMSSNFKNLSIEVNTVDAQPSQDGGVIVAVAGSFSEEDQVTSIFFQTFFLARQKTGFFVLNDNLRVFAAYGSIASASAANPVTLQTSGGVNAVSKSSKSSPTEKKQGSPPSPSPAPAPSPAPSLVASDEKAVSAEKVPSVAVPTSNSITPPNGSSTVPVASGEKTVSAEKVPSVAVPTSNSKTPPNGSSTAPVASGEKAVLAEKVPSVGVPTSNSKTPPNGSSTVPVASGEKAVSDEKVPSVAVPTSNSKTPPNGSSTVPSAATANSATKISYASMVAKVVAPVISSEAAPPKPAAPKAETPKAETQKAAVVAPKASLKNGMSKSSGNIANGGKSAPQANPPPEARGVFIGGLPFEITEKALRDSMNQFGPIKKSPDAVQIRKHQDGFCLAFVEFESPDSARCAIEVHHVKFGEKQAYIAPKRSFNNRGGPRSPTRAGLRNGNGNSFGHDMVQATGSRQSRTSGNGPRKTSRDGSN